ncbi:MAG: alanine dehydrogenase [Gammaproteobacteria bacterium]|nr:alanine dehydrogenase [Gammaproteobacteria bacterium]
MRIGVPKETKVHEYRVGLTPTAVAELTRDGHTVVVEENAGAGIGFSDGDYVAAGACIGSGAQAFAQTLVVKVKEPNLDECAMLGEDQVLFTYLHLAADPALTNALLASGAAAIAYETVTADDGSLPLLSPMSEIAGRMSVQVGANALQRTTGGSGVLLGGVPGVAPARVVVIGGGMAGANAATIALGLGADVTILDKSVARLRWLADRFDGRARTVMANASTTREHVLDADLVVGAVLVPGARAPKLVGTDDVRDMRDGSVLVDISIDQGGCFETSRPTTHDDPTFVHEGVVHYCVTNMPGVVPHTATLALNNITLPYVRTIAEKGWRQAIADDPHLANGVNVAGGSVWHEAVAQSLDTPLPATQPGATHSANPVTTLIELPYAPSPALAMATNA